MLFLLFALRAPSRVLAHRAQHLPEVRLHTTSFARKVHGRATSPAAHRARELVAQNVQQEGDGAETVPAARDADAAREGALARFVHKGPQRGVLLRYVLAQKLLRLAPGDSVERQRAFVCALGTVV